MRATCAAASGVLTVMRTSSEPARQSSNTCCVVAAASAVSVLVIDCTTTGAPPPIATLPTITCVEILRAMRHHSSVKRATSTLTCGARSTGRSSYESRTCCALPMMSANGGLPSTACSLPAGLSCEISVLPPRP